ncbi:hypothetical protein D9611_011628 [Ephemerocybe angulata]|uniref:F-box domain-containing protein n=1 Tax=Ephemerocybe angulata TaxID=980116 RepID=A0A8H5AV09_9AGAR|nr:hypothetical protein D9611_011628 [Tulosesus angulatus]
MDVGQECGSQHDDQRLSTRPHPWVSYLPHEIFGFIFSLVQRNGWIDPDPLPAEVTLSHVCRHWRHFTLDFPSLWSVFRYDSFGPYQEKIPVKRLAAYLERSKDHPLELFFDLDLFEDDSLGGWSDVLSMLHQIIPHIHRVRELHVISAEGDIDDFLSKLVDASAPLLEALTIRSYSTPELFMESTDRKWSPTIFTGGAPSLKYLRSDDRHFSRPPIGSILHLRLEAWANVVPDSETFSPSLFHEILSLPYLQTLSMWGELIKVPLDMVVDGMTKIEAKSLKHFRCDGYLRRLPQYFLSHVSAPSLESLTFHSFTFQGSLPPWIKSINFPSLHTLAFLQPWQLPPYVSDLTHNRFPWLFGLIATTHNLKKLVLSLPPDCGLHGFLDVLHHLNAAQRESPACGAGGTPWSDTMEELTLDVDSHQLEARYYTRLTECLPNLTLIRTTKAMKHKIDSFAEQGHQAQSLRWSAKVRCVGDVENVELGGKPFLPLFWALGPDWIDGDRDPFVDACEYNVSSLNLGSRSGRVANRGSNADQVNLARTTELRAPPQCQYRLFCYQEVENRLGGPLDISGVFH